MLAADVTAALIEFSQLPIPGVVVGVDGTILALNAAAEVVVGRRAEEVVRRMVWDLAPGAEYIWQDILAAAREQGVHLGEITIATPQAPRLVHYALALREVAGATYALALGLVVPDARTAYEGEARAKYRLEALGLVAGGIAHDFNNQLVSVLAEATAAREDPTLSEASRDALRRIEAAAHRMAQLTRQLLAYAGRGRFVTERLDPDDLVEHTRAQLGDAIRSDARLGIACSAGRVAIEADRALLRQVLTNLVTNASDALGDGGGDIEVRTGVDAGSWVLSVTDTGSGMDELTVARMFDPFFATRRDHHGLGLPAVHGIVRRLGGEIAVDSKVGEGTTVTVRLPLVAGAQPPRARSTSTQRPRAALAGLRILVADDEPSVLATVRRLLERRGANVVVASDGAQAKEMLSGGEYDLVLLDVMMPELTGYQLLPFARELQPNARVMLMSGYTDPSLAAGSGREPDAFLEKPFTAAALDHAIREVLARD